MELLPSNFADIRKYYCDTYVKLTEFGDQLFYVTKVTSDSVFFKDSKGKEGVIYLHEEEPYSLTMNLPHKSMYQLGNKCYSIGRYPARQYSKGISVNNCRIYSLELYGWEQVSVNFETLAGFVTKPAFLTLEHALSDKTKLSVALSPRFALMSPNMIYCDQIKVGVIVNGVISINPLFKAEFLSLLQTTAMSRLFSFKD